MNLFNKSIAGLTAIALTVSGILPIANVAAQNDSWESVARARGNATGITTAPNEAALKKVTTREEFITFLSRFNAAFALGLDSDSTLNCEYTDLASVMGVLQGPIMDACAKGIIKDADTNSKVNPKTPISQIQAAMMLARMITGDPTIEGREANEILMSTDVLGDYAFTSEKTDVTLQKDVAVEMLRKVGLALDEQSMVTCEEDPTMAECLPGTGTVVNTGTVLNPVSNGNLSIGVAATSPAAKQIPSKGNNIKVLSLDLTAGGDDVVVNSIVVSKYGFTNTNSVKELYFRNANDVIITNLRALNNDGTASLTIKGGLVVKAGATEKLQLFMNVDGGGAEQYQFAINSVSSVATNARTVVGTFPMISNKFDSVLYASQTVRFTAISGSAAEVTVGDMNTEVGKFQLEVVSTGTNTNDVIVRTITLKNLRSITDNLDGLVLKTSSATVSVATVVTDKFVTFTLSPDYTIEDGQSRTFYVYGNVVGGEVGDTVKFSLDATSDIYAYEKEGYQASAFVERVGTDLRAYDVQEGDNLITKASDSTSASYIDQDSSDTLVMIANVNFKSMVSVEKMLVTVADTDNVVDTISVYANAPMNDPMSVKLDEVTVGSGSFTKELSIYKDLQGLTRLYFYVETEATATDAKTFTVSINNNSFPGAEYIASNNPILAADINGSATSSVMTTKTAVLNSLSRVDGFSATSETVVAGDKVYLGEFALSHNNVRDVRVTSITVDIIAGSGQYVNNLTLSGENMEVVRSVTSSFSSPVVFNSLNMLVPKNTTKKFKLYGNINTSYTGALTLNVAISDAESIKADGSTNQFTALTNRNTAPFIVEAGAVFTVAKISDSTPATSVIVADVESLIARYDFRVSKDSATIQELAFTGTTGAYNAGVEFAVFANGATSPSTNRQSLIQSGNIYYVSFNGLSLPLGKDVDTSYFVKSRTSSNIDSTGKTNVDVVVTLVSSVAGTTAKTKIISNANSSEITAGAFAISTAAKTSNVQYLRRTNLTASAFTANTASARVTLGTNNASNASVAKLPLEFNLAGISGIVIDRVEVAGVQKAITAIPTITSNGVVNVVFTSPVDLAAAGTTVEVFYTVTINAGAQTVSAKVRIPQGTNTDFTMGNVSTFMTTGDNLVWSDKADANTTLTNGNWFSSAKVIGLPTAFATIQ